MTAARTRARPGLPAGYVEERERDAHIVALPSVIEAVRAAIATGGTMYDAVAAQAGAASYRGRGAAYRIPAAGGDWLVRHYRRGGAVTHVLRDEYLRGGEPRPLRELRASAAARSRGVPTPEVLAAVMYAHGLFYRGDLVTRFVPHSRDLAAVTLGPDRSDDPITRANAWGAAGVLLRNAFTAGVTHPDLNLRNILIAAETGDVHALLIDLDRARVHGEPVSAGVRSAMLARLHRSRRKLEQQLGARASEPELAAFDEAVARH